MISEGESRAFVMPSSYIFFFLQPPLVFPLISYCWDIHVRSVKRLSVLAIGLHSPLSHLLSLDLQM